MRKYLFLLLLLVVVVGISCKKGVVGTWVGTYTCTQFPSQGSLYYSFIVKPDGTLLTESKGGDGVTYYGVGNWTLTGTVFKYTLTAIGSGTKQSGQLTFNNKGALLSGTWHDTNNSPNLNGTFSTMNKVD